MLLKDKNAVIYGAAGSTASGVAKTFAREGARVFLVGRTQATLDVLAAEIRNAGGQADVAVADALDPAAVDRQVEVMVTTAGSVDVSFNLLPRGDVQGIPLIDMTVEDLLRAVTNGLTTHFYTARAAARQMVKQGNGSILMLTSGSSNGGTPMMGSTSPADAAMESFMRSLAAEVGPSGVRVNCIWTAAVPETLTPEKIAAVNANMQMDAAGIEQLVQAVGQMTMLRRAPALQYVADTAAFLASDSAGAITGTVTNVTCGMVPI
jgi:NAD(P)-dependent dehydrogenase (short-subunit alcohol dehydrogenase family)